MIFEMLFIRHWLTKRITNIELPKYFLSKTEISWHKESIEYYFVKEVSIIKDVIIADAVRTPMGNHDGMIRDFNPVAFVHTIIKGLLERTMID